MEIGMESDRDIDVGGDRDIGIEMRTDMKREKQEIKQAMGTHFGIHRNRNRNRQYRSGHTQE